MCRVEAFFSLGVSRAQKEKLVSQALLGNGYPKGLIQRHTCPQSDRGLHRDSPLHQWAAYVQALYSYPACLPSIQDAATGVSAPQVPSTSKPSEGSGVQDSMCQMPLYSHTYIGQVGRSFGSSLSAAPPDPEEWRLSVPLHPK